MTADLGAATRGREPGRKGDGQQVLEWVERDGANMLPWRDVRVMLFKVNSGICDEGTIASSRWAKAPLPKETPKGAVSGHHPHSWFESFRGLVIGSSDAFHEKALRAGP